jgi:glycosyltransferase involved in cell wall biosynthesis
MACGTPIITSDVNGLKEIAGNAALLVDPADTCAIAGAIMRLAGEPQLREALVERGRQRSTLFSWDSCARKTLEILEAAGARKT